METKARKRRKPTALQKAYTQGYEPGSVASSMTTAELREFRSWLKRHDADDRVYRRQLGQAQHPR